MELVHQMRRRRLVLRARWLPRLQNDEADQLTNMDFRHFDPKERIPVSLERLGFQRSCRSCSRRARSTWRP